MSKNKQSGDIGEKEVVKLVPCPNYGKDLMLLPPGYPLYDVQCTGYSFRAQVKTNASKPKTQIFGAGWQPGWTYKLTTLQLKNPNSGKINESMAQRVEPFIFALL